MTLYFENTFGFRRVIAEPLDEREAYAAINAFLKEHNYKSYYTRSWINESNLNEKIYDVGSHSEFFICYNSNGWSEI